MNLSVIIVNYNVVHELAQCLESVRTALQNIDGEVFIIDNNSSDNSCEIIRDKFPWATLIANNENVGFAKANNQAIRLASGEYILLLNPDTIVESDSFTKMLAFMDAHPDGGGLGVKMLDGNGKFLPESKRGIPTPFTAFCKLFGLWRLAPKSDKLNHYYLGALPNDQTAEIEILAGACMLIRKSVLDTIGLLDERYFLYGEDVDISYRILQAGYKNYYFPETHITHFKGRSTQKYKHKSIIAFYQSMKIFSDQYMGTNRHTPWALLIKCGIYIRAGFALIGYHIHKSFSKS